MEKHCFKSAFWNEIFFISKCQFKRDRFILKCFKQEMPFTTSNHFVLIKKVSVFCSGTSLYENVSPSQPGLEQTPI